MTGSWLKCEECALCRPRKGYWQSVSRSGLKQIFVLCIADDLIRKGFLVSKACFEEAPVFQNK